MCLNIEKIKINFLQKLLINDQNISVNLGSHQNTRAEPSPTHKSIDISPSLSDMEFSWLEEH
jgi:hypothetical protein